MEDYNYTNNFIYKIISKYGFKLTEDIVSEFYICLYTALKTYHLKEGKFVFDDYAAMLIEERAVEIKEVRSKQISINSNLSLNQVFYDGNNSFESFFKIEESNTYEDVELYDFIDRLGLIKSQICKLYIQGYNEAEISSIMGISVDEIYKYKAEIKNDLYNDWLFV